MKLYSAKIRLAGNTDNEVVRYNMSAAELKLLEFVHAGKHAAVVDVKHTGDVNRTEARERDRLAGNYSKSTPDSFLLGPKLVEKLFGVGGVPLPLEYAAPVFAAIETYDLDGDSDEVITPVNDTPITRTSLAELTG